jgi:EAL domain-containing protein (putative c-di-GMP-specific phosphodiesterase class I)
MAAARRERPGGGQRVGAPGARAGFHRPRCRAIIDETGIDADQLELELTESILMDPESPAYRGLVSLRALGVHFSIDDFGTGYSSLSYVKRFPISMLKIDQSFVRGCRNANDAESHGDHRHGAQP